MRLLMLGVCLLLAIQAEAFVVFQPAVADRGVSPADRRLAEDPAQEEQIEVPRVEELHEMDQNELADGTEKEEVVQETVQEEVVQKTDEKEVAQNTDEEEVAQKIEPHSGETTSSSDQTPLPGWQAECSWPEDVLKHLTVLKKAEIFSPKAFCDGVEQPEYPKITNFQPSSDDPGSEVTFVTILFSADVTCHLSTLDYQEEFSVELVQGSSPACMQYFCPEKVEKTWPSTMIHRRYQVKNPMIGESELSEFDRKNIENFICGLRCSGFLKEEASLTPQDVLAYDMTFSTRVVHTLTFALPESKVECTIVQFDRSTTTVFLLAGWSTQECYGILNPEYDRATTTFPGFVGGDMNWRHDFIFEPLAEGINLNADYIGLKESVEAWQLWDVRVTRTAEHSLYEAKVFWHDELLCGIEVEETTDRIYQILNVRSEDPGCAEIWNLPAPVPEAGPVPN